MKILIVGDFSFDIYEKATYDAFSALGYNTEKFSWKEYFSYSNTSKFLLLHKFFNLYYKIQRRYSIGPAINKINKDLIKKVENSKPDLIFIYRGIHILPKTILKIQNSGALVVGYNNDDPFGKEYPSYFWRHFIKSIPLYNYIFSYRLKNLDDYNKINYKNTSLLRSYYIKDKNYPLDNIQGSKYNCDVIFIGHFEDDGRDEYIMKLIEENIDIKLFGTNWEKSKYYSLFIEKIGTIIPLREDYNLAINSAKIALVFLSKLNNDTYTRRVFEIIATKRLMVSVYTDDLNSLFENKKEAVYFNNKEDLVTKIKYYLNNESEYCSIVENGFNRLMSDGHEVQDRAQEILRIYNKLRNE